MFGLLSFICRKAFILGTIVTIDSVKKLSVHINPIIDFNYFDIPINAGTEQQSKYL